MVGEIGAGDIWTFHANNYEQKRGMQAHRVACRQVPIDRYRGCPADRYTGQQWLASPSPCMSHCLPLLFSQTTEILSLQMHSLLCQNSLELARCRQPPLPLTALYEMLTFRRNFVTQIFTKNEVWHFFSRNSSPDAYQNM